MRLIVNNKVSCVTYLCLKIRVLTSISKWVKSKSGFKNQNSTNSEHEQKQLNENFKKRLFYLNLNSQKHKLNFKTNA